VAIYFIVLLRTRTWIAALATAHWRAHVHRALAGFAALVLFFYALSHLPQPGGIGLIVAAGLLATRLTAGQVGSSKPG
jgi:hypothetical protein